MKDYLPYITSVVLPIITSIIAYLQANKRSKQDIEKLREEHKTNIEELEKRFKLEMESKAKDHKYKLELMEKEIELQTKAKKDNVGNDALEKLLSAPEFGKMFLESMDLKGLMKESIEKSKNNR